MKGRKIINSVTFVIMAVSAVMLAWIVLSWVDVLLHQMDSGYTYSQANFFRALINLYKVR